MIEDKYRYFTRTNGVVHAGTHLVVDLWGARRIDCLETVRTALTESARACAATLCHLELKQFDGGGGVYGVAMLSQSHITIHSWPECGYAAVDCFLCGPCDPYRMLPVLQEYLAPERMVVSELKRGTVGLEAAPGKRS
jgi:S-adenosylmethionine decarboxylase